MRRPIADFKGDAINKARIEEFTARGWPRLDGSAILLPMLTNLHVSNFAIIDQVSLTLDAGLTVITGETGAGKSIIVGALGLLLGARADQSRLRDGADRGEVTAEFDISGLPAVTGWLKEQDLPEEDGACHLRRVLKRGQSSRAFINGTPVPASQLAQLGDMLLDIHGQHENQRLMLDEHQRELLDGFGRLNAECAAVQQAWSAWRALEKEKADLESHHGDPQQLQLLRYQVDELSAFVPLTGELEQLEAEHQTLSHAGDLLAAAQQADALVAGEDGQTISDQLSLAIRSLEAQARHDQRLEESLDLLQSARSLIDDAHVSLSHYCDAIELEPERLAELDQRLGQYHELARKHRVEPAQLADHLATLQQQLDGLDYAQERRAKLDEELAAAQAKYQTVAQTLNQAREEAGRRLSEQVTGMLADLGMADGQMHIALNPAKRPSAHGIDQVCFMIRVNTGHQARPLAQVASGGELSRISLAIQVATQQVQARPSLIFDEVDTGISGAVAETVGQMLRRLGKEHQVFCVTHLPQVAAQANQHLRAEKTAGDDQRTSSVLRTLDAAERLEEIARMLGGATVSKATRDNARELIAAAR